MQSWRGAHHRGDSAAEAGLTEKLHKNCKWTAA
ncbi:hypothetical protein JMJ77_0015148 [Colletotrichum scovillei]|uniref:Uncharacterized protein n=1 Tax=Colletotrichum scovillei TaxID=1209932 RepID=A0A9P7UA77_9PEZI|nr:hypothetical protein JMJ77_0015148 [Colletotrichum scovillei]KAG7056773.1 hypothetical protein JMJ78_0000563 [Colletotrichum scovillei]KAG7066695.1 hypothetical protein JMJ76_0000549 [Colletotrichum scovillei]